jgi:hypothetical protein
VAAPDRKKRRGLVKYSGSVPRFLRLVSLGVMFPQSPAFKSLIKTVFYPTFRSHYPRIQQEVLNATPRNTRHAVDHSFCNFALLESL